MSMIVQFQGPNGPIFVHRDNIVTIATTPQLGLQASIAKGRPSSPTVVTLDTGAALTVHDDPLHAAEKWEKAFEEDFEDLDEAFADDDFSDETTLDRVASGVLMQALAAISSNPTQLPELATLSEAELTDLRLGLEAWAESRLGDPDDDAWDDDGADDEEDDDADA